MQDFFFSDVRFFSPTYPEFLSFVIRSDSEKPHEVTSQQDPLQTSPCQKGSKKTELDCVSYNCSYFNLYIFFIKEKISTLSSNSGLLLTVRREKSNKPISAFEKTRQYKSCAREIVRLTCSTTGLAESEYWVYFIPMALFFSPPWTRLFKQILAPYLLLLTIFRN